MPRKLIGGIELPKGLAGRYQSFLSRTIPYRRRAKQRMAAFLAAGGQTPEVERRLSRFVEDLPRNSR